MLNNPNSSNNLVELSGSDVSSVNGNTLEITPASTGATINVNGGRTLSNTGTVSAIHFGAADTGTTAININGNIINFGGGYAIDSSATTNGVINVALNSTSGSIIGDVRFGLDENNLMIFGNGTYNVMGSITGNADRDTIDISLDNTTDVVATGGAISLGGGGSDSIDINSGTFLVNHDVTVEATYLMALALIIQRCLLQLGHMRQASLHPILISASAQTRLIYPGRGEAFNWRY